MQDQQEQNCASCGARLSGPWCAACGERARKPGEVGLGEYFSELIEALTNLEGRFWRSFRALLFRPGLLTTEYMAGRRVNWMRPLHLFLLINLAYFLLSNWNTFSTPLFIHVNYGSPYQEIASDMVNRRLNDPPLQAEQWEQVAWQMHWMNPELEEELRPARDRLEAFAESFNRRVETLSRTLVILLVPLMAMPLMLGSLLKSDAVVRALLLATHMMAWFLLFNLPLGWLAAWLHSQGVLQLSESHEDLLLTITLMVATATWLTLAIRRVYDRGWLLALGAALLINLWLILAFQIYRLILFFVVFWTVPE